jgi:hypothetical protein
MSIFARGIQEFRGQERLYRKVSSALIVSRIPEPGWDNESRLEEFVHYGKMDLVSASFRYELKEHARRKRGQLEWEL